MLSPPSALRSSETTARATSTCRASQCRAVWGIFSNPHRGRGGGVDRTTIICPYLTDGENEARKHEKPCSSIGKARSPDDNPGPSGSKACGGSFFLKHCMTLLVKSNTCNDTSVSCFRLAC